MSFKMKKLIGLIEILRPINLIITFASIFVAGLICSKSQNDLSYIFYAAITGALVGSAGNVINDFFDIEIDKINRPSRPLPANKITPKEALILYFILNMLAIILAIKINILSIIIVVVSIVTIFFYSYNLKKIPLVGNFVVSFFTGLAFVFGGAAVGNISDSIIPAVFAFLINMIREIIKDIEDIDGDVKSGVITFPAKYGIKKSIRLMIVLTFILLFATIIPFAINFYKIEYFIIVMLTVNILLVYFVKNIIHLSETTNLRKMSNLLKIIMIFGLIAIFYGS